MNLIDQKLIEACDRAVRHRRSLELQIARKTISALRDAGFELGCGEGECNPTADTDDQLIEELFACDQGHMIARKGDLRGWVFFVFGNDGWDAINDYTVNLEPWISGVLEYADTLS